MPLKCLFLCLLSHQRFVCEALFLACDGERGVTSRAAVHRFETPFGVQAVSAAVGGLLGPDLGRGLAGVALDDPVPIVGFAGDRCDREGAAPG